MINFIGIGAQKAGTSWIYACLYEHPKICAPVKEIHFFSRSRFAEGKEWYEHHFRNCNEGTLKGEFSTSYLYSAEAAKRIATMYPEAKIIAVLRNPIDRAYSQYRNSIKSGEIRDDVPFEVFVKKEKSVIEQGKYATQLQRYFDYFKKEQVLVLVYEDIAKHPGSFMQQIYQFLGVDETFVPSMLNQRVNVARTPKSVFIERITHQIAEFLRRVGLDRLVWFVRLSGLPDMIRNLNTKLAEQKEDQVDRAKLADLFQTDVIATSRLIGRDLTKEWLI